MTKRIHYDGMTHGRDIGPFIADRLLSDSDEFHSDQGIEARQERLADAIGELTELLHEKEIISELDVLRVIGVRKFQADRYKFKEPEEG